MKRIPEPELMEDQDQCLAYSKADFSTSDSLFVNYILERIDPVHHKLLDIGSGPGDVAIELAKKSSYIQITAIDGSSSMVEIGLKKVKEQKLTSQVSLQNNVIPNLPIEKGVHDVIISKDLLHHLHDPMVLWHELDRLSDHKTQIFVMDLIRPSSEIEANRIVEENASQEMDVLKTDFYNSLLAAFTLEEIEGQLKKTSLTYSVETIGNRHFIVKAHK